MPAKKAIEKARKDKRAGKSASTQAGEFVREEIEHVRQGKHGARSTKQAIAIGLSEARRAGVDLPPPKNGKASAKTTKRAKRDLKAGRKKTSAHKSTRRSRATKAALKRDGHSVASKQSLSKHSRESARKRSAAARSASAKKASRTKGRQTRSAAARKAARTKGASRSAAARKAARTRAKNRKA
ncbi:MAG: DUF6496 domain-containing protein [Rhodanobacteraceae bacterium]